MAPAVFSKGLSQDSRHNLFDPFNIAYIAASSTMCSPDSLQTGKIAKHFQDLP